MSLCHLKNVYFFNLFKVDPIICQKSDFHETSDFQSSQKLEPLKNKQKILGKNMPAFKDILAQEVDSWCIKKVE
jgi:hypothetical protein